MRSWDVVARYEKLSVAMLVIEELLNNGYKRKLIGWAVNSATEDRDITLTITNGELAKAIQIFQHYHPDHVSVREVDTEQSECIQVVYLNHNENTTGLEN